MKFIPIHSLKVDEHTCDIKIKGPMSAMLAANAVTQSDDFKTVQMTGLYELIVDDEEQFTTMLHADEEPRTIPIYCLELSFNSYVVIGDLGTDSLPILIYFGKDKYTFAKAYKDFPFINVPSEEEIVNTVNEIDSTPNREMILKGIEEVCNNWFNRKGCGRIMIAKKAKNIDVTRWWYHLPTGIKRNVMKKFLE